MPRGRRGRPLRRESFTRQTRSRTATSLEAPPPPTVQLVRVAVARPARLVVVRFADARLDRFVVRVAVARPNRVVVRFAAARFTRFTAARLLRPEPALAPVSAAFGSAAQMAADSGHIPAAVQGPSFCQGNARATPWPTSDTMPGTELFTSLPGPTRAMIDSCTSASLPLDARIPDGLRAKIWADDYIDLAIMLKPTLLQHQEYSQAMYGGMAHPQGDMSPRAPVGKASYAITTYERWLQAFNLYMSVYLLLPANVPLAVKMLKYEEIIRGLAEEGGDWRTYDEAFRSLRFLRGWAWDSINWELWLKASQSVRRVVGSPVQLGTPFPGKGRARSSYVGPCFSYNRGEHCDRATCYFAHKCQSCGGSGHPAVRCYQAMGKRPLSSSPPVPAPPPPTPPQNPSPSCSTTSTRPSWTTARRQRFPSLGQVVSRLPQFVLQFCRTS